jgi:WD40 repeat protein
LDADTGKDLQQFEGEPLFRADSSLFSPDGKKIIMPRRGNKSTKIFDVDSGKELHELQGITNVPFAAFSPVGKKILTVSTSANGNNTVQIWDGDTDSARFGKEIQWLKGETNKLFSAEFLPDGKKIVSSRRQNGIIQIWNVDTGRELQKLEIDGFLVRFPTFSPDGKKIVVMEEMRWVNKIITRLWDVDSDSANFGKELRKMEGHFEYGFSPDGKTIITSDWNSEEPNTVRIWDTDSGKELHKLTMDASICDVIFSPDGNKVAIANENGIEIWDANLERILEKLEGHEERIISIVFSPDGKKIMSVEGEVNRKPDVDFMGRSVRIYDLERWATPRRPAIMDF